MEMTEQEQIEQEKRKTKAIKYNSVFAKGNGPEILEDMKRFCRYTAQSMTFDSSGKTDPYLTAYFEGRRSVILSVISSMSDNASINKPEQYIK